MLLTIDLGNSTASMGIFNGGRLVDAACFNLCEFPKRPLKWIKSGDFSINSALVISVNPKFNPVLSGMLSKFLPRNSVIWLNNGSIPIKNRYKNVGQVGIDRLVNVYGGGHFYGFPCLVIDIGTAVTFDFGSPSGSFEGGMIFPGPYLSVEALTHGTARIGSLKVDNFLKPSLVGRTTEECVISGISVAYSILIPGIIQQYRSFVWRKWKKKLNVVVTGGFTDVVKPCLKREDHKDKFLTLKSLAHLSGRV